MVSDTVLASQMEDGFAKTYKHRGKWPKAESFRIGTAAQGQRTPVVDNGTSDQTSLGAGTSGEGLGPSAAGTGVHEQPTQSTGTAGQSQSPQSMQASMPKANPTASAGNPPMQPSRGVATSAPSQTPRGTGEAQVWNAQTPCTCV